MPHTVGLAEASRLTGKSQSTIHRAMKTGRISYKIEEGARQIDAAELSRVFGVKSNGAMGDTLARHGERHATQVGDAASLQRVIEAHEATIRDLRARLDAEGEERRKLTALLTDRRPWWRRLVGR